MRENTPVQGKSAPGPSKRQVELNNQSQSVMKRQDPVAYRSRSARTHDARPAETKHNVRCGQVQSSPVIDPFRMHPTNVKTSHSLPLESEPRQPVTKMSFNDEGASTGHTKHAGRIDEKVGTMLAASRALKPVPELESSQGLIMSRIVGKVSGVLKLGVTSNENGSNVPIEQRPLSKSPNAAGHGILRRNGKTRLRTGQHVAERIRRNPTGGKERLHKSVVHDPDPATETGVIRSRGSGSKVDAMLWPRISDPFSTEEGFEENLDCGFLSTPPEGCSTPRFRRRQAPPRGHRCREDSEDILSLFLRSSTDSSGMGWKPEPPQDKDNGGCAPHVDSLSPETFPQKRWRPKETANHKAGDDTPDVCKRVKKHPSPDKVFLESLEEALQKYNRMKVEGAAEEDLDELASNFRSPSRKLAPRDSNRLLSSGPPPSKPSPSQTYRGMLSRNPQRAPQTHRVQHSIQGERRPACLFRPSDAEADEVDELL